VLLVFCQQIKCDRYWPEEPKTYGPIRVVPESSEDVADYIKRVFALQWVGPIVRFWQCFIAPEVRPSLRVFPTCLAAVWSGRPGR